MAKFPETLRWRHYLFFRDPLLLAGGAQGERSDVSRILRMDDIEVYTPICRPDKGRSIIVVWHEQFE